MAKRKRNNNCEFIVSALIILPPCGAAQNSPAREQGVDIGVRASNMEKVERRIVSREWGEW